MGSATLSVCNVDNCSFLDSTFLASSSSSHLIDSHELMDFGANFKIASHDSIAGSSKVKGGFPSKRLCTSRLDQTDRMLNAVGLD